MTDATADELATKAIDLRTKELAILKKYYGEMKKALGPRIAGRLTSSKPCSEMLSALTSALKFRSLNKEEPFLRNRITNRFSWEESEKSF